MDTSVILDSGHTAWMIVATLLVFMMTIPRNRLVLRRPCAPEKYVEPGDAEPGHSRGWSASCGWSSATALPSAPDMKAAVSSSTASGIR